MMGKIIMLIVGCAVIATIGVPTIIIAHSWKAPKEAFERQNPTPKNQDSIERGKALYRKYCASCHGKNGQGDGALAKNLTPKPADLVERAAHHSDGDFAWKITNGRGAMPAFKDQLSENEIWDLINFIKKNRALAPCLWVDASHAFFCKITFKPHKLLLKG